MQWFIFCRQKSHTAYIVFVCVCVCVFVFVCVCVLIRLFFSVVFFIHEIYIRRRKQWCLRPEHVSGENFHSPLTLEVFTEDPRPKDPGPGTRTGSGLYFKWSAGSGSGPNLLLLVPGLFNFVCNTRVDRRTPHPPVISVSQHACNLQFVKLG